MQPEAEAAVQSGVFSLIAFALGLLARWGYYTVVAWWERTERVAEHDTKAQAAQRKEDRANYQGVIEELYRHSDRQEEDIKRLQAELDRILKELREKDVQTAELRAENVALKRHVRALRKALKDAGIKVPGWDEDERPESAHDLPAPKLPGGPDQ